LSKGFSYFQAFLVSFEATSRARSDQWLVFRSYTLKKHIYSDFSNKGFNSIHISSSGLGPRDGYLCLLGQVIQVMLKLSRLNLQEYISSPRHANCDKSEGLPNGPVGTSRAGANDNAGAIGADVMLAARLEEVGPVASGDTGVAN
jgi:hypothetical protein